MGTISKMVQHGMESSRQIQMRLDELRQPGWGDTASYISERDMMYVMAELKVPVFLTPQTDTIAATPSSTRFGEHMQTLDIVPGQLTCRK